MFRYCFYQLLLLSTTPVVLCHIPKYMSASKSRYHLILRETIFNGSSVEFQGLAYIIGGSLAYPVTQVQFYSDLEFITLNSVFVNEYEVKDYQYNASTKVVNITFPFNLNVKNELNFFINYSSRVSIYDTYGIYRATYQSGDEDRYYIATRFPPIYARRVIPCLDEPTFKSGFEFYISHPKNINVLGNKIGEIVNITESQDDDSDLVTSRFNATSEISPHDVAFVMSEFTCTPLENAKNITTVEVFRVCSRNEYENDRNLTLQKGAELMNAMNDYTDYAYSMMGFAKLDFVAVPDYPVECACHAGLIICREDFFLADETKISQAARTRIIKNLAKQITQIWFGNSITNKWWNDKFFYGDAFAGYFEYFLTNEIYPEMDLGNLFLTKIIPQVFEDDSFSTSEKLQGEDYENEVDIVYQYEKLPSYKGAILLYTVKVLMGESAFKTGFQYFVSSSVKRNPIVMNCWNQLNAQTERRYLPSASTRLYEVMDTWTLQPGFPLVTVSVNEGSLFPYNPRKIIMTQERFMYGGKNESAKWYVPIAYTVSSNLSQFSNSTPKCWLNLTTETVFRYDWTERFAVFDNNLSGFYRVHLDDTLWNNVTNMLNNLTEFESIPAISRAKILNDAFEMIKIGRRNFTEVFAKIEYLKNEVSIYPWRIALREFEFLVKRVGVDTLLGQAVKDHFLRLMETVYKSVPWSNLTQNYQYTEKQVEILTVACEFGYQDCVDNALTKNGQDTNLINLKGVVYCTKLKYANESSQWINLADMYENSRDFSERLTLLDSLGCTSDENLLFELLSLTTMDYTPASIQEGLTIFKSVISHDNTNGLKVALDFLEENYQSILKRYGGQYCLKSIIAVLVENMSYDEINLLDELRTFISNSNLPENLKNDADKEISKGIYYNQWLELHLDELEQYYGIK